MTVTSIIRVPEVGEVGAKATFRASGEKVGTELRYYLAYAPVSSALKTLDTVATDKRSDARLQVDSSGAAYFTPDVPGHYQVEVHDVTVTTTPRKYAGAPFVPDTDNDFSGAPSVNLSTLEAFSRYDYGEFMVAQTVTRTIGSAPNTLAVALRMHDSIELRFDDAVVLTPSTSKVAQIAAFDDSILGCRDVLTSAEVQGNRTGVVVDLRGRLQVLGGSYLEELRAEWNEHLSHDAAWEVHNVADTANKISPATEVTTLADALARLILLRTKFEAHAINTGGGYHDATDTVNKLPAGYASPTDLASGIDWARRLFKAMVYGTWGVTYPATNGTVTSLSGHFIAIGPHKAPFDPLGNYTFDFSESLTGLLRATNELTRIHNLHLDRTSPVAPHSAADTYNRLLTVPLDTMTVAETVAWANAFKDSIERHTADVYLDASTGQLVANVNHQNTRPIKIGKTAGNMKQALELIELCCIAYEAHALDGGPTVSPAEASPAHATAVLGNRGRPGPWPVMTRLQAHWQRATLGPAVTVPDHFNNEPASLFAMGWE